ncbi:MAG: hypothetical protein AAFR17_16175 [Pseudomonadota bacterium]
MVLAPMNDFVRIRDVPLYSSGETREVLAGRLDEFIDTSGELADLNSLIDSIDPSRASCRTEGLAVERLLNLIAAGQIGFVVLDQFSNEPELSESEPSPDLDMSERVQRILDLLPEELPKAFEELGEQFVASLTEIRQLVQTIAISLVFVVGAFLSGIGAAIVTGIGFALKGWDIFEAVRNIWRFVNQVAEARTDEEFRRAAFFLATAIAILGIAIISALLKKAGGNIARRRRVGQRPSSDSQSSNRSRQNREDGRTPQETPERGQGSGQGTNGRERLLWGSWNDYPKETINGREYARIGDRYYSRHAVDRMQPSGLGAPAGADGPGRNVTPNMVEHVVRNGTPRTQTVDGVVRTVHRSGNVSVVTEDGGRTIITILRHGS